MGMPHDNDTPREEIDPWKQIKILTMNSELFEKRLKNREEEIAKLERLNANQAEIIKDLQDRAVEECPTSNPEILNGDGFKFDGGKNRMGYVMGEFPRAFAEIARIGTDGGAIHGDGNWCRMPNAFQRWMDAHYRHLNKYHRGELIDQDSHSTHLGHAAWSAMALLEMHLVEMENFAMDRKVS